MKVSSGLLGTVGLVLLLSGSLGQAAVAATAPPLLTTVMVPSGAGQGTEQGATGVLITYNSTYNSPLQVLVHMSLLNSAGQTVTIESTGAQFAANESLGFFFGLAGVQAGAYVAHVFAATNTGIPLSTAELVNVTVS